MSASKEKLGELHNAVAQYMLDTIQASTAECIPMSAADLGVMVTFLKNNNITAEASDKDLQNLRDRMAELKENRGKKATTILQKAAEEDAEQKRIQGLLT